MAGGVVIDGAFTALPGVYSQLNFGSGAGRPPLQGVIAIVGEFPFLEQNVPYGFTTQASMERVAPNLPVVKRIANQVYNPSDDPATPGVPRLVYLVSPKATTQASALLYDSNSDPTIELSASIWGPRGNQTLFRISPNAALGGSDVRISNNGYSETFRVPAESSVLTLNYAYPDAVAAGTTAYGFEDSGCGSGVLSVQQDGSSRELDFTFARTVPGTACFSSDHATWYPTDPGEPPAPVVASPVTVATSGVVSLVSASEITATVVGFDDAGASTSENLLVAAGGPGVVSGSVTSIKTWSRVTSVSVYSNATEKWSVSSFDGGTGTYTATSHGFVAHDVVRFYGTTLPTGITAETDYFVIAAGLAASTFRVSATRGGAAITGGSASAVSVKRAPATSVTCTTVNTTTGVFSAASHGLLVDDRVRFYAATGGALPSGVPAISAGTDYYVLTVPTAGSFTVGTSAGGATVIPAVDGSGTWYVRKRGAEINGNLTISGSNFPTVGPTADTNLTYVSEAITYLSDFSTYGFVASTASPKAASIPIVELDQDATTAQPYQTGFTFGANAWKLKTVINANSTLVEADYAASSSHLPVYVPVAGYQTYLSGGTATDASSSDWAAAFDALTYYDVNTVVPFIDDTYAPAPLTTLAAVHGQALSHAQYMNGVGGNPRNVWGGAEAGESYSDLVTRVVALNSHLFNICCDEDETIQFNGVAERLAPVWTALKLASMENGSPRTPLTHKRPRSTNFFRDSDLLSREATSELLRAGVTALAAPPGEGVRVERAVTTYVTDADPTRTESSAARSCLDSIRGVQAAVRGLVGSAGTSAMGATIESIVRAELSRQVSEGWIRSFDTASLTIEEYGDRWQVNYSFSPLYPVNFIVINATANIPTSSTTSAV